MSRTPMPNILLVLYGLAACLVLAGCVAGFSGGSPSANAGLNCVDDSKHCLAQRKQALTQIMDDKQMHWINAPATAKSDASGVRLFAYMKKRKQLSCTQLRIGHAEAVGARQRLRQAAGSGLTPAQISRGAILGDEVAQTLRKEMRRKGCRKAS